MNNNGNRSDQFSQFHRFRRVRPANFVNEISVVSDNGIPTEVTSAKSDDDGGKRSNGKWLCQLLRIGSINCDCHANEYPAWTGEVHGLYQEMFGTDWLELALELGIVQQIYDAKCLLVFPFGRANCDKQHNSFGLTNSHNVRSLGLPAITVCPKVPDALNFEMMYKDMLIIMPNLTEPVARDLIKFWIGGSGLENMNDLANFNISYLKELDSLYKKWGKGREPKSFFRKMQAKYGYKCEDFFNKCELGGHVEDCCDNIFKQKAVMRRGFCYQTKKQINQTDADDIGRLVVEIKRLPSISSPKPEHEQIIIYINDDFEQVLDFSRFYLYPNEWNRMHFIARRIELLDHLSDCTNNFSGKDSNCILLNWLSSTVIRPHNCTLPYLENVKGMPPGLRTCEPLTIAKEYNKVIKNVHTSTMHSCIPGCNRWEYSVSLQQSPSLQYFVNYAFNLEVSFYDLQYEHVKEVATITPYGFMSQIGGQFGFFLGLSIITVIQIFIWAICRMFGFIFPKANFIANRRRKIAQIIVLFGILVENKDQEENVRQRDGGESSTRENIEWNDFSNRKMKVPAKRRSKGEKETLQKRRLRLTKQKSFDNSEQITKF